MIIQVLFYSAAIASPLGSKGNHPGTRQHCSRRRKICEENFVEHPTRDLTHDLKIIKREHRSRLVRLVSCTLYIRLYTSPVDRLNTHKLGMLMMAYQSYQTPRGRCILREGAFIEHSIVNNI